MKRFSWTTLAARLATAAVLLVATNVAQATPVALSTPGGLNNGDKFRFLFVTAGKTDAMSSDISTYNAFVQAQAGGATYNGVTVNWRAIGSTSDIDARTNVGGFGTTVGIYLPSGSMVASDLTASGAGLWSGSLLHAPNEQINGTVSNTDVWTGTVADGTNPSIMRLGSVFGLTIRGTTNSTTSAFLDTTNEPKANPESMYGLSEELTAGGGTPVPEIDPAGMGSVLALVSGALGLLERRRRQTA